MPIVSACIGYLRVTHNISIHILYMMLSIDYFSNVSNLHNTFCYEVKVELTWRKTQVTRPRAPFSVHSTHAHDQSQHTVRVLVFTNYLYKEKHQSWTSQTERIA